MDIRQQINKLRKLIEEHNHKYYVLDKPTVTDFEYDKLIDELTELESEYPQLFDVNSPTQNVGGQLMNSFESMNHDYPMLSLSNTYSNEELFDFEKRIKKLTDKNIEYVCELKFDGVSISLKYENGVLIRALTRGDGIKGDNVIENIKTIKKALNPIPLYINKSLTIEPNFCIIFLISPSLTYIPSRLLWSYCHELKNEMNEKRSVIEIIIQKEPQTT